MRLKKGHLPRTQGVQLMNVIIRAVDLVADVRKARGRRQSHITRADDGYFHRRIHPVKYPCDGDRQPSRARQRWRTRPALWIRQDGFPRSQSYRR